VEVVVGVDAGEPSVRLPELLGHLVLAARQVADVADRGLDVEAHLTVAGRVEVALDRPGLGGRLDDDEGSRHTGSWIGLRGSHGSGSAATIGRCGAGGADGTGGGGSTAARAVSSRVWADRSPHRRRPVLGRARVRGGTG